LAILRYIGGKGEQLAKGQQSKPLLGNAYSQVGGREINWRLMSMDYSVWVLNINDMYRCLNRSIPPSSAD
jgi:hypothetical protein